MPSLKEMYDSGMLKIGDCIDYNPDVEESVNHLSYYRENICTDTDVTYVFWGIDAETGKFLITTERSVNKVSFFRNSGFYYGPKTLHEICKACYSNKHLGAEARSITLEDLNAKFDKKPPENPERLAFFYPGEKGRRKRISHNKRYYKTFELTREEAPDYDFLLVDEGGDEYDGGSWERIHKVSSGNPVYATNIDYTYDYKDDSLLYDDDEYWLASHYIGYTIIGDKFAGIFSCYGIYYANNSKISYNILGNLSRFVTPPAEKTHGIRPIISLDPSIQVEEMKLPHIPYYKKVWKLIE